MYCVCHCRPVRKAQPEPCQSWCGNGGDAQGVCVDVGMGCPMCLQIQGGLRRQSHSSSFPGPDPGDSGVETLSPSFPSPPDLQGKGASPSPGPQQGRLGKVALGQEEAGLQHPCVCTGGGGIVPCPDPTPNFGPFPAALPPSGTVRLAARHHGYHCLVTGGRRGTGLV